MKKLNWQFLRKFKWWHGVIAGAAALAALLLILLGGSSDGGPLLRNGDFSQLDDAGMPLFWYTDAYNNLGQAVFEVVEEDGSYAAHIINRIAKDTRFAQQVAVEPDSLYHLHGWIRANAEGGLGANLSVEGVYSFSEPLYSTHGNWQEVSLYGRTQTNQKTVTVFARLGGYSGEALGEAWFRDLSLEKVEAVPEGYSVLFWAASANQTDSGTKTASTGAVYLILFTSLYIVLFGILLAFFRGRSLQRTQQLHSFENELQNWMLAGAILLGGLAVRIATALIVPGYDVDILCFTGWARRMADLGPARFYQEGFCDYPPGYLWILWLLGGLGNLLGTGVTEFMVKLPPILADTALGVLLFAAANRRLSGKAALALISLYVFNPLIITTGAAWGQADALMVIMLILVVLFAVRGRWILALPCYIFAVLLKPQALMFGPLGLAALGMHMIREIKKGNAKRMWLDVGLGLIFMAVLALIVVFPFSLRQSGDWLLKLYSRTMNYYDRATVNGCNLYFLLGKNWGYVTDNISASPVIPLLAFGTVALPLVYVWLKRMLLYGERPHSSQQLLRFWSLGGILLSGGLYLFIMTAAGRLTYSSLGTCMIILCVLLCCAQFLLSQNLRNLPIYGAICLLMLFNTGSMMHERYLVPAIALLLLGYLLQEKKDNRLLWLMAAATVTGFLNVGCVLNRNIRVGGSGGHLDAPLMGIHSDLSLLEYAAALGNTVLCALSVAYGFLLCRQEDAPQKWPCPKWKSCAAPVALTVVYAVLAFTNLGSFKAPQTAWVAESPEEQVTLDLGYVRDFHLSYYGGIHQYDSDFTVEVSADGERWSDPYTASMKIGECFKWKYVSDYAQGTQPITLNGRYIRVTAGHYDLTLFEMLALDPDTHAPLPVSLSVDSPKAALADEPEEENPKNAWTIQESGEQAVLDLGEERIFHLSYHGGAPEGGCDFTVETSSDLTHWDTYTAFMSGGQPFGWQQLTQPNEGTGTDEIVTLRGRYIRVTADQAEWTLNEIAASDAETGDALHLSVLPDNLKALCLIDEPDTMEGEPGWYNSTYFDEIYHARTGYELLHGMQPYEWTHPPLGKVFMSWSIALFGMTPFGWRFAGALAGVLMLPGLYLLGKLLTRRKWGGLGALLLMALDLMHYTQTRIATIDSFVVLFIIWMYYFMLRWFYLDFYGMKFWKTLIPLALSGLMMGFAIASKWTGCYAGLGLAVIFFWGLWRRIRQYLDSRNAPEENGDAGTKALPDIRRIFITVGCCFIFFVFVPLIVYYCSYIPFFGRYDPAGISVKKVIEQAVGSYFTNGKVGGMLGYHSQPGLGMDHYFYSPWYQWPLIAKPMWYSSSAFEAEGFQSSIMAMGNPAVWWVGLIALFTVLCLWGRRHIDRDYTITLFPADRDSRYGLLLISFFAQYLPWMLVPRGTYIYHYFPGVPFIILCTVFCLDLLAEKRRKAARILLWTLVGLAAVLFIVFFPYASGIETSQRWMDAVKWFPNWLWY